MSSIENSRKDLKISGYNPYKTFNTENKNSNYEKSNTKSVYSTFTDKESVSNGCPECGGEAMYICECEFKDKQCSKGHVWHINKYGSVTTGDPHEK
jgi:hypothetical protein